MVSDPGVLVIDDDFAVREAINAGLRMQGYDLMFAENGVQALEVLAEATPRVVILDLRMPEMDGLELLANLQLKRSDPYSVVVLTAHVDEVSAGACYEAGVCAVIRKPYHLNELRGAVRNAIVNNEVTRLFKEGMIERVANEMVQDTISQRLDVLGRYLQELAGLQRMATDPGKMGSASDTGGLFDWSKLESLGKDLGSCIKR